ncbi:MAG: hypothetical protein GY750_05385 [Lentisphaerae bacterium]|nr:hypothetical protein [Lentisphaerota bacterium]MCP4100847.1 hypothetical protein [Lentisphaerota bacterium]
MAINKTKRVEFGKMLKLLLTKYSIKQKKLADLLSRAPQYISAVIAGHRSFTGEQCNIINNYLSSMADPADLKKLTKLYIESNVYLDKLENIVMHENSLSPVKRLIFDEFDHLNENQQLMLFKITQLINHQNLNKLDDIVKAITSNI